MKTVNKVLGSFFEKERNAAWFIAAAGIQILCILMQMNFVPANDAASRYAPMARAFSEENWAYAFHPHSGVLFSSVSGSLAYLLHLDGFRACQAAALLLWGLAAVPLYFIAMHIWQNRKTAAICEILYLLCSHLQRYVYDGIRDNGKSLGIFLLVYGILLIRDNKTPWKTIIITSLGSVILMLLRIDGVQYAVIGLLVFIYFDIKNNKNIRRSIFVILFHFILISPQLYMNLQWSGYPVLNSRMAQICEKIGLKPMGGGK